MRFARTYLPLGTEIVAIADARLEPLWPEHAALFDRTRSTAYTGALPGSIAFVQLSPMTHDPLFVAGIVNRPDIFTAAVVYDFIPEDEPSRYLPTVNARLKYGLCKFWLSKYDAFMPISRTSAVRLAEIISIKDRSVIVTGAPIDPAFEHAARDSEANKDTHVLVVGGGDPRKNVECAIRAHALCVLARQCSLPLIITGDYSPAEKERLLTVHRMLSGDTKLLQMPGKVSEQSLAHLYRSAICVVVPSLAEGFSLPVVEAMSAGTPVIASQIPAHEELITSPDVMFPPGEPTALALLLERLCSNVPFRRDVLAAQANTWQRYRGAEVARVFWSSLLQAAQRRSLPAPAVGRKRRPKIAILSPLPPARSGVADYTAASLLELSELAEIHVFTDTRFPKPIAGAASIRPLTRLPSISGSFDRVVGVMGNSHFHHKIFKNLVESGGACIEHDNRLLGFYCGLLGMSRASGQATRELGRPVSEQELITWLKDENRIKTLFLGELAEACEPLLLHSKVTARMVHDLYGVDPVHLPFAIYRTWPDDALSPSARLKARAELGIKADEIVIASFGLLHPTKGSTECIWALEMLRSWGIPASLHFVGGHHKDPSQLKSLCKLLGIEPHVCFVGDSRADFVNEGIYRTYLQAADLGIQLRTFGLGGLSGALLDCISVGLPTVANCDLATAMEAPDYVARVPDNLSPVLIAEALLLLLERNLGEDRCSEARRAYYAEHNFRIYAERLCAALALDVAHAEAA